MAPADSAASLGDLVAERPSRAALFERLGFDFCCGGAQTLGEACAERGLDAATVAELIEALDEHAAQADPVEDRDWRAASSAELCDHIVAVHHEGLRRELPRISELMDTVARVHGPQDSRLADLKRVFGSLRAELLRHIEIEESVLFPACRALDGDGADAGLNPRLIDQHEAEHEGAGEALAEMRRLAGGYDPSGARCGTHAALLDALRRLEADTHRHIHEENNILFPRVRELAGEAT